MADGKVNGRLVAASTFAFWSIVSLGCFSIADIISCSSALSSIIFLCSGFGCTCFVDFSNLGNGSLVRNVGKWCLCVIIIFDGGTVILSSLISPSIRS